MNLQYTIPSLPVADKHGGEKSTTTLSSRLLSVQRITGNNLLQKVSSGDPSGSTNSADSSGSSAGGGSVASALIRAQGATAVAAHGGGGGGGSGGAVTVRGGSSNTSSSAPSRPADSALFGQLLPPGSVTAIDISLYDALCAGFILPEQIVPFVDAGLLVQPDMAAIRGTTSAIEQIVSMLQAGNNPFTAVQADAARVFANGQVPLVEWDAILRQSAPELYYFGLILFVNAGGQIQCSEFSLLMQQAEQAEQAEQGEQGEQVQEQEQAQKSGQAVNKNRKLYLTVGAIGAGLALLAILKS